MMKYILFLLLFGFVLLTHGQKKSKIKFSGNIGLFYDYYSYDALNYAGFRPRYEPNLFGIRANANIQIGKYFSIPFGVNISNQTTTYNLPNLPEENMMDYIQNPRNNIHIDPKYKWFKGHIGSHTPNYSNLTTGDIQIFGAGFTINPGKFILSANYGISQRAVEPDPTLNIAGAYKQKLIGAQIGYGKIKGSKIVFNVIKIKDEITSINMPPIGYNPIEGITVSPLIEIKLFKNLTFKTETAASLYTDNLFAPDLIFSNEVFDKLNSLIRINASSVLDYSHNSSLTWKSKKFLLGGEIKYIGAGFMPVGYRNIEKDIIDYKINTGFKLFHKKVNFKGSFGIRTNNVNNTTLQSTKRLISSLNVFAQITQKLNVNFAYSNFGFNNNISNPALRIEMINNSISVSPTYQFKTKNKQHIISANVSFNNFDQFDVASSSFVTTKTQTYNANYRVMFKKIPLNLGAQMLLFNNESAIMSLGISSFGVNGGYLLKDKKIRPSISLNYMTITRSGYTPDTRFITRLKLKYKVNKKLNFKISYNLNNNSYGTAKPGASLQENRVQFSINKKF